MAKAVCPVTVHSSAETRPSPGGSQNGNCCGRAGPVGSVTSDAMKHVLGQFGTGVVIATASAPHGPIGMTCQSFVSLSLDPPLVSLCPSRTSTSWPHIRSAGHFCVNVLAGGQTRLSNQFARSGGDKFQDVGWAPSTHGAPVLAGVTAWIECKLWREYDGGDHTIAVAEVLDLSADPDKRPLLFLRGEYVLGVDEQGA